MPEPAWHRNQRKQRQLARGLLAAYKLGVPVDTKTFNDAALRLSCHHGSSVGAVGPRPMAFEKGGGKGGGKEGGSEWKCKRCLDFDGMPFKNRSFRTHCFKCNVHKGKCHGGEVKAIGNPTKSLAQRQMDDMAKKDKHLKQQLARLEKENAELKKESEGSPSGVPPRPPEDSSDDIRAYEEVKANLDKLGLSTHEVVEKLRVLRAKKAATIPHGQRLKTAEQVLARKTKQHWAVTQERDNARKKLEELDGKVVEHEAKVAEAQRDVDSIRKLVGTPVPSASVQGFCWTEAVEGQEDFFKIMPPDLLEEYGMGQANQLLLKELSAKAVNLAKAARAKTVAAEEEVARKLAEEDAEKRKQPADEDAPMDGVAAGAASAKAAKTFEEKLLEYTTGGDDTVAEGARAFMATLADAKAKRSKPY